MVPLDWPGCRQTVQDRLGDALGSVRQVEDALQGMVDDTGAVLLARDYSPFWPGASPFTHGFRDRIQSKANILVIRSWLKTLDK